MRRLLLLASLLISLSAFAQSEQRQRLHFCFDWGYAQNFYKHHHFNILSEEGYRINENTHSLYFQPNSFLQLGLDYEASNRVSVGLSTGISGLYDNYAVLPLLFCFNFFPRSYGSDGLFAFFDSGIGLRSGDQTLHHNTSVLMNLGAGYRTILARSCRVDFRLSLRSAFTSPLLPNPDGSGYVTEANIRANSAEFYSLCFSVAIGI